MYFVKLGNAMNRASGLLGGEVVGESRWAAQVSACRTGLGLLARDAAEYDARVRYCPQFFAQFEGALQAFCALADTGLPQAGGGFRVVAPVIDAAFSMVEAMILFVREKALRTGYAGLCAEEEYLLDFFVTSELWPIEDRHNMVIDIFYVQLPAAVGRDMGAADR